MNEYDLKYLKSYVVERFHKKAMARDIFPVKTIGEFSEGAVVPVLSKEYIYRTTEEIDFKELNAVIDAIATEEDMLCLSGEHTGWSALGIKGLSTAVGRHVLCSEDSWPQGVFSDIASGKQLLRESLGHKNPVLIVPSKIYSLLELIAWHPPRKLAKLGPKTYLNLLRDEKIVSAIYSTNCLFADDGGTDSVLLYEPNKDNFILSALSPTLTTHDSDSKTHLLIRESIAPHIENPSSIVEITNVITKDPTIPKKSETLRLMYDQIQYIREQAEDLREWADYVLPRIEREPEFTVTHKRREE